MAAIAMVMGGLGAPTLLERVLLFASAPDTAKLLPSSTFVGRVAASDAVWVAKCEALWADKVYVPQRFREAGELAMSRMCAYWGSLEDSKRVEITVDELCTFEWSCRMKGWAGPDWTRSDPWWRGEPAALRRYRVDGSTESERGSGRWRFVFAGGSFDTNPGAISESLEKSVEPLRSAAAPVVAGRGRFVRHARGGREFPTHIVSRYEPNWGWVLQNCWGFSASFPLPPKGVDAALEDDGELCQRVTVDSCREEATRFNLGLPLPHEDAETAAIREADDGGIVGPTLMVMINGVPHELPRELVLAALAVGGQRSRGGSDNEDGEEGEEDEEEEVEEEQEEEERAD